MANKYLDKTGLQQVWAKVTEKDDLILQAAKNHADSNKTATESTLNANIQAVNKTLTDFIGTKGIANGLAPLDSTGKVPTANLPSYVDDVLEFATRTSFPSAGETGKIYVAQDTNMTYRWTGTTYAPIKGDLTLGETSSTAYAGDKGKANADAISNLTQVINGLYPNPTIDDMVAEAESNANTYTDNKLKNYETSTVAASKYQSKLVSGTNIKTVNNTSLLGSGNIAVQPTLVSGTNIKTVNGQSILGSGNIAIEVDNLDMSGYYTKTETNDLVKNMAEWDSIPSASANSILVSYNGKVLASPYSVKLNFDDDSGIAQIGAIKDYLSANYHPLMTALTTEEINDICV